MHSQESTNDLANLTILVAEDESLIALDIEDILQRFGCTVVGPFCDLQDVITAARTTPRMRRGSWRARAAPR